jgi:hypothetical protein
MSQAWDQMSPACVARLWTTGLRSLCYILADLVMSAPLTRRATAWRCVIATDENTRDNQSRTVQYCPFCSSIGTGQRRDIVAPDAPGIGRATFVRRTAIQGAPLPLAITLPSQFDQEATTGPRSWRRLPPRGPVATGPP